MRNFKQEMSIITVFRKVNLFHQAALKNYFNFKNTEKKHERIS